jgi:hypothetical protein
MSTFPTLGGLQSAGRSIPRSADVPFNMHFVCGLRQSRLNLFRRKREANGPETFPEQPPPGDKDIARTMAAQIANRIFHSTSAILARRFLFGQTQGGHMERRHGTTSVPFFHCPPHDPTALIASLLFCITRDARISCF